MDNKKDKEEAPNFALYNGKWTVGTVSVVVGAILAIALIYGVINNSGKTVAVPQSTKTYAEYKAEQFATSTPAPAATPTPAPLTKIGDKVAAGKFGLSVASVNVTTQLKSDYTNVKTEDQFVVVKVTITNNDDRARDVSTNMFTLADGSGKTYKAYGKSVGVSGDEFLFYETINPGLSRSRSVAFETPKGISGLKLIADSGVALAGGSKVTIDLGQ